LSELPKLESTLPPLPLFDPNDEDTMTDEREHAILFTATLLSARKLIHMDPNKPSMAKGFIVDTAIDDAAFILEGIDKRWPAEQAVR
jgi:hypothetical protein